MKVTLIRHTENAFETSVASARTCYSADPVLPEEVSSTKRRRELRDSIAASTLAAGHLTTRQHAHFTFLIQGVSRGVIWSFLHSHPHYNSEQVSQRYVEAHPDAFVTPPGLDRDGTAAWEALVSYQVQAYFDVADALFPSVERDYYTRFPARRKKSEKYEPLIRRLCLEDARYLLPQAVTANLYHTVSALTLLRYLRMAKRYEFPEEATELSRGMLEAVLEVDPLFERDVQRVSDEVDSCWALDERGETPWSVEDAKETLGDDISALVGVSGGVDLDDPLLVDAMDPTKNGLLLDNLGLYAMDRRSQLMEFVQFTFLKALSLTADAQSQRHRAIRRYQTSLPDRFPAVDGIRVPYKVRRCPDSLALYRERVSGIVERGRKLPTGGPSTIHYGLPNATVTHFMETGSLLGFYHRWKMRLCLAGQDEMRQGAEEEVAEVTSATPLQWVGAPCHLRKWGGRRPYCPEGNRFCGVKVWEMPVARMERV